jgi:hypothetical protein
MTGPLADIAPRLLLDLSVKSEGDHFQQIKQLYEAAKVYLAKEGQEESQVGYN